MLFVSVLWELVISSRHPVVIIPGLMASLLNGDVTTKPHWYCSKIKKQNVWFNDKYAVPPLHNCLLDYIGLNWNNQTNQTEQRQGVNLTTVDFGGLGGMTYIDTIIDGVHVIPCYKPLVDALLNLGYVERQDIFGIPYDWRYGLYHPDSFWDSVRNLIEEAYYKNENKKVILIGHSMGCYFINYFCMNRSTSEWRQKFISSVNFLAPSFGGSFMAFEAIWTKKIPFLSFLGEYPEIVPKIGGVNIHMPNFEVFKDTILYVNEKNENYYAKDLKEILISNEKMNHDILKIFEMNEKFSQQAPPEMDIPTSVVYNSGLPTIRTLNMSKGHKGTQKSSSNVMKRGIKNMQQRLFREFLLTYDESIYLNKKEKREITTDWYYKYPYGGSEEGEYSYGGGDMVVNSEGPEYVCKNWRYDGAKIDCLNLEHIVPTANHLSIMWLNETIEYVLKHIRSVEEKDKKK